MNAAAVRRIVVVGNGIAGSTAAHSLRDAGFEGELTVVGDEPHPAYSRPALSKALLRDAVTTAHELPAPTHGALELRGVRASGLDVERRLVSLDDGAQLPYERLVLATGSRTAAVVARGRVHIAWFGRRDRTAPARRRKTVSRRDRWRPLGMEVASGCLDAGCHVTLVSQGLPLELQLGPYLARVIVDAALAKGIDLIETRSARLDEHDSAISVVLEEGAVLEAELVLSAAGDVPNAEWLADSGLVTGNAVRVDERALVRPDIAAVGDLAVFPTPYGPRRIPLWNTAIEHGKVAAAALLHGETSPALSFEPYFWTEQFGLTLKAVGYLPLAGEPSYVDGGPGGPALMRWTRDGGRGTAVALEYRIPIPRLRRLCDMAGDRA